MATPKDNTTTKKNVTSMGMTFESGNPSEYPIAYGDNVWDNVSDSDSKAKELLGTVGQYDQHTINEALAVEIVTAKGFYTASLPPVSELDGLLCPVNGGNYFLGDVSSLGISNACQAMTAGCTIVFNALVDFTVFLPYFLPITDGTYDAENDEFSVDSSVITPDTDEWYRDTTTNKYYAWDDDNNEYYEIVYPAYPAYMANASNGLSVVGGNTYMLTITAIQQTPWGTPGGNVFSLVRLTSATPTSNGLITEE